MGSILKGILGPINGAVGTVVGSRWRGIDYIRSRPGRRTTPPTASQLVQQAKFALAIVFIRSLKTFFEVSYKSVAKGMTGPNAALSQVLKNAITGIYPNLGLDFSKVAVSAGSGLPNASAPVASSTGPGDVTFNWTASTSGGAAPSDKAMVIAYCEDLKQSVYNTAAAQRSDLSADLDATAFSGKPVHTWIVFISENGKKVSESKYTGVVNVQ